MIIICDYVVRFTTEYTNKIKECLCETEQEAVSLCLWLRKSGANADAIHLGGRVERLIEVGESA